MSTEGFQTDIPPACPYRDFKGRHPADGRLRWCLRRDDEGDVRELLRRGATDQELEDAIGPAVRRKSWGHDPARDLIPANRGMSEIGG